MARKVKCSTQIHLTRTDETLTTKLNITVIFCCLRSTRHSCWYRLHGLTLAKGISSAILRRAAVPGRRANTTRVAFPRNFVFCVGDFFERAIYIVASSVRDIDDFAPNVNKQLVHSSAQLSAVTVTWKYCWDLSGRLIWDSLVNGHHKRGQRTLR